MKFDLPTRPVAPMINQIPPQIRAGLTTPGADHARTYAWATGSNFNRRQGHICMTQRSGIYCGAPLKIRWRTHQARATFVFIAFVPNNSTPKASQALPSSNEEGSRLCSESWQEVRQQHNRPQADLPQGPHAFPWWATFDAFKMHSSCPQVQWYILSKHTLAGRRAPSCHYGTVRENKVSSLVENRIPSPYHHELLLETLSNETANSAESSEVAQHATVTANSFQMILAASFKTTNCPFADLIHRCLKDEQPCLFTLSHRRLPPPVAHHFPSVSSLYCSDPLQQLSTTTASCHHGFPPAVSPAPGRGAHRPGGVR